MAPNAHPTPSTANTMATRTMTPANYILSSSSKEGDTSMSGGRGTTATPNVRVTSTGHPVPVTASVPRYPMYIPAPAMTNSMAIRTMTPASLFGRGRDTFIRGDTSATTIRVGDTSTATIRAADSTIDTRAIITSSIATTNVSSTSNHAALPNNNDNTHSSSTTCDASTAMTPTTTISCMGVSRGSTAQIIAFVGSALSNTGDQLVDMSREEDGGLQSFCMSLFGAAGNDSICLPFGGMIAKKIENGFAIHSSDCTNTATQNSGRTKVPRCDACKAKEKLGRKFITRQHQPTFKPPTAKIKFLSKSDYKSLP